MRAEAGRGGRVRVAAVVLVLAIALAAAGLPWAALASAATEIVQRNRTFAVAEAEVEAGTTVRFTNEDDFPHQIHVTGPDMNLDSPLQGSGQVVEVAFPAPGTFDVRCGIHPRMRMSVRVKSPPANPR